MDAKRRASVAAVGGAHHTLCPLPHAEEHPKNASRSMSAKTARMCYLERMTIPPITPPALDKTAFHCPHCHAFSRQFWAIGHGGMIGTFTPSSGSRALTNYRSIDDSFVSFCDHCKQVAIWIAGRMVYPDAIGGVPASTDMPTDIKKDFDEARSIVARSPRGAAALLRLCIEKLCKHLLQDRSRGDVNADIGRLVQEGLPPDVQRALDTVRVIGNESVHAGLMDFRDDPDTANKLFGLVNFIVQDRITRPKEIAALYGKIPQPKLEGIEKRDGGKA